MNHVSLRPRFQLCDSGDSNEANRYSSTSKKGPKNGTNIDFTYQTSVTFWTMMGFNCIRFRNFCDKGWKDTITSEYNTETSIVCEKYGSKPWNHEWRQGTETSGAINGPLDKYRTYLACEDDSLVNVRYQALSS